MAWYNTSYQFKKKITLNHSQVSGASDLSNYPALISVTDANLKTTANGGYVQNSSGFDIIFVDSTETTLLNFEIENYVATTGEIEMWVGISTLSHTVDTIIYMYFGNASINSSQANPTAVWDANYQGVWHMKETSGTTLANSTSVASLNATKTSATHPNPVTGIIAGGQQFNNPGTSNSTATDFASIADNAALDFGASQDFTVSAWVKTSQGTLLNFWPEIISKEDGVSTRQGYNLTLHNSTSSAIWYFEIWVGGNAYDVLGSSNVADGNWHYLVGKRSGSTTFANQDGTAANSLSANSGSVSKAIPLYFGSLSNNGSNNNYIGVTDEIRISNIARSDDWIKTEYNNQNVPGTFLTFGPLILRQTLGVINSDGMCSGWIVGGL